MPLLTITRTQHQAQACKDGSNNSSHAIDKKVSSGETDIFEFVSWAPAALTTPDQHLTEGPTPFFTEELLSCSQLPCDSAQAPSEGDNPPPPPQPPPLAPDEAAPGPPTGLLRFSHGGQAPLPLEWGLTQFHHHIVCITVGPRGRRLWGRADGAVTTDPLGDGGDQWFVTDAGDHASVLRNRAHGGLLHVSTEGAVCARLGVSEGLCRWRSEDAGAGGVFLLSSGGQLLQCTPDGALRTSSHRRSWELCRLTLCSDHENVLRDLARPDEPLMAVSALLPLLRSYCRPFAHASHQTNPIPYTKALALSLAYFLSHRCHWQVTLPEEVLQTLTTARPPVGRSEQNGAGDKLSVLSWKETIVQFSETLDGPPYVVDFDFQHKFSVLRRSPAYAHLYETIPSVFLGPVAAVEEEIDRLLPALTLNFRQFGMSLPWWRTAQSLKALYGGRGGGDGAARTHQRLGLLGVPPSAPHLTSDGLHHLAQTVAVFLRHEASTASSPAGALSSAVDTALSPLRPPLAPFEEDWDFDKEISGVLSTPPEGMGLLSQHFSLSGWPGAPRGLFGRAKGVDPGRRLHMLRHVATPQTNLCDMASPSQS